MKAVQRKNDSATCGCPNTGCSPDVFVNGQAIARLGVDSAGGRIAGPGADRVYANGHLISLVGDGVVPHGTGQHRSPRVSPSASQNVVAGEMTTSLVGIYASEGILVAGTGPLRVSGASSRTSYLEGLCRRLAAFSRVWTTIPFTNINVYDEVMKITGVNVKQVCGEDATDTMRGNAAAMLSSLPLLARSTLLAFERFIAIVATGSGAGPEVAVALESYNALKKSVSSFRGGASPINSSGSLSNCGHCVIASLAGTTADVVEEVTGYLQFGTNSRNIVDMARKMGIVTGKPLPFVGENAAAEAFDTVARAPRGTTDFIVGFQSNDGKFGHWFRLTRGKDGSFKALDPQTGAVGVDVQLPDMGANGGVVLIPATPKVYVPPRGR